LRDDGSDGKIRLRLSEKPSFQTLTVMLSLLVGYSRQGTS